MSREIKFRGKRYKHGNSGDDWVYGDFYHSTDGRTCIDQWVVKPKTVGQYTGLKDKNVEIYEGDIVATPEGILLCKLMLGESGYYFAFHHGEKGRYHGYANFEIIGNIYENPELLK